MNIRTDKPSVMSRYQRDYDLRLGSGLHRTPRLRTSRFSKTTHFKEEAQ